MINPIGNQLTPANLGLNPAASDYPAVRAPAAQQVAPPGDTQSSLFQDASQDNSLLKQQPEPPKSSLEKALDAVNDSLKAWSTGMRFDMDEDAHQLVVSIVDSETGKVLRKIPSEAMLRIARMIAQFQGTGVDTQA
ncbi:flagellar protein FlaG [Castellaniella caeni]|uniref:flagellar protein FlaG n=1 Tax=Castellaniella caeni TaxID=266123 RepID=UPI000836673E|nr:flagellar protein FlaG [Castellaniella caeni]